jgi:hypothetical protein
MPTLRIPSAAGLFAAVLLAVFALAPRTVAAEDDWKFDVVLLKNGHTLRGLLVEQTPAEIQFRCVSRKPGSHTVVIPTTLLRAEVDHVDLLDDAERDKLAARLKALDPTGKGEAARMASLDLKPVPWGKDGKTKALRYESTHFVLESNAPEDVARRVAVQLEQLFAAYARFLPPRHQAGQPTTILLAQSLADYQALLKEQGRVMLNPAFYDTDRNEIVCGTDVQRLGEQLEQARQRNQHLLKELKEKEAELNRLFKGQVPANLLRPIQEARDEVGRQNRQNDEQFQAATRQMFRALYHEAFHAYLATFVYPPSEANVPRWLNEGLAQIFEAALVEAGELRVGHADKVRLKEAQAALRRGDLVALPDLLRSGRDQFVVRHASELQTSDRSYLTSWAVAFYLTFERRLLGTRAMDEYVQALHRHADPVDAFRRLVGQEPARFETEFRQYLSELRPDGTVAGRTVPAK